VARGYKALKLRLGDGVQNDIDRLRHVRKVLGEGVDILTDASDDSMEYDKQHPKNLPKPQLSSLPRGRSAKAKE